MVCGVGAVAVSCAVMCSKSCFTTSLVRPCHTLPGYLAAEDDKMTPLRTDGTFLTQTAHLKYVCVSFHSSMSRSLRL